MLHFQKLWNFEELCELAGQLYAEITCLLLVSLGILHIDQDLTTASFQGVYREHSWLQHLVAMRLDTCTDTVWWYILYVLGQCIRQQSWKRELKSFLSVSFLPLNPGLRRGTAFTYLQCSHELLWTAQVFAATAGLPTRSVGFGLFREKLFGLEWSSGLQFCFGELRQVGHDWVLIHIWVHNLFRGNHLKHEKHVQQRFIVYMWE